MSKCAVIRFAGSDTSELILSLNSHNAGISAPQREPASFLAMGQIHEKIPATLQILGKTEW